VLEEVVGTLKARAGELFGMGRDDLAIEVRRLAVEFDKRRAGASATLDLHIKRAIGR
jgi:hypothetical protein